LSYSGRVSEKSEGERVLRILVTGGSGFIGNALIKRLEKQGHKVFNYDIMVGYDITNDLSLSQVFKNFDPQQVYHICAQAFLKPGELDPKRDISINEFGMLNVLKCLENHNVPMVYTSSGAVYGLSAVPHAEYSMCIPVSNYGISKFAAEQYLRKWVITKGIDAKIIRFSSVYGANRTEGPVNIFINKARDGKPLTVYGDGLQTRDMVHVDDALQGLELVLNKGVSGETYNIGTGVESSVLDVANIVSKYTGAEIQFVPYEMSAFDLKRSWYDIDKIAWLGYRPKYDLEKGILCTMVEMKVPFK
jgi:nucleoside-diphosphate-sugar epimerase